MWPWHYRDLHIAFAKGAGKAEKIAVDIHFSMVRRYTQVDPGLRKSHPLSLIPDCPGWGSIDVMAMDGNWAIGIMNMHTMAVRMIGAVRVVAYASVSMVIAMTVMSPVIIASRRFGPIIPMSVLGRRASFPTTPKIMLGP